MPPPVNREELKQRLQALKQKTVRPKGFHLPLTHDGLMELIDIVEASLDASGATP